MLKKGFLDLLKREAADAGSELLLWLIATTAITENRVLSVVRSDMEIWEDGGLRTAMAVVHCRSNLKKIEQVCHYWDDVMVTGDDRRCWKWP
ncbi:hypothetical protein ACLOJK_027429 [Asimina triloba]